MLKAITFLLAAVALSASAGASMRCQGQPADSVLVDGGGAVVTGEIIEVRRDGAQRDLAWARFKVLERRAGAAPDIIRLRSNDDVISHNFFIVGRTHTFALSDPFGEAGVTRCQTRFPR